MRKKINYKKVASRTISTILALTLLFMIFVFISSKASDGEPKLFGYEFKTVLSGSMEPTFSTGSVIALKPVEDPSVLKTNDIVTFMQRDNSFVTHRIIDVIDREGRLYFQTKGDNNAQPDMNLVPAINVTGVYTGFSIPILGYFIEFSRSNAGAALLLIIPGVLLVIYSVITLLKAFKEIDPPKETKLENTNS
ncbi:signal peptidase I SipW [Salirhabdus salicampi]|uniref:signal peptidase I SipW n=1 Tax=Salirhabdus salicampi TaxID=476102 RepID=UPI0020C4E117|nr:signal peptidase I [Salirhabdus salicampi]MCP8615770.1 signal peptidase I [Salirhabdus salicampi]